MRRIALILTAFFVATPVAAQPTAPPAPAPDSRPRLGFSIAERGPAARIDGPLLNRVKAAIAAARESDAAWRAFLTPDADAQLISFADGRRQAVPFTAETIRAAAESCIGPYAFDEGADWVQLSWVCRTDNVGPLAPLLTFRNSPELSLTVWFEGDRIKTLEAMEPLMIPGARRYTMDAWQAAQGNH